MSAYPEHDKMSTAQPAAQVIGDFLEWLTGERGLELSKLDGRRIRVQVSTDIETLLYEYFEIDRKKIDAEKEQMLEVARAQNAAAGVIS